jgi:hypothetical protein
LHGIYPFFCRDKMVHFGISCSIWNICARTTSKYR